MSTATYFHLIKVKWPWSRQPLVFGSGRDSGGENQFNSVDEQQGGYLEFIDHYSLINGGFFGDKAKLSSKMENRTELNKLIHEIERRFPQIDDLYAREKLPEPRAVVVVWKFNRLSRDPKYAAYLRADWALRGVLVLELAEPEPTGNPITDEITFIVKRQGDRQLLDNISIDARRGQAKNMAVRDTDPEFRRCNPTWPTNDGRYIGVADGLAPLGFRGEEVQIGFKSRDRGDHKGIEIEARIVQRLVVDEQLKDRCCQAWRMRHEGYSLRAIHKATHLFKSEKGYPHFFQNLIYTGDYEHGGIVYEKFVPALIPREWYEEEKGRRQERQKKREGKEMLSSLEPRRVASKLLLSGKLFCGSIVGELHPMHGHRSPATRSRPKSSTYECSVHKHSHGEDCPYYGISQEAVDAAVVNTLLREVITRDNLRPLVQTLNEQIASHQTFYTTELTQLQEQIANAERQRRKYAKLIDDDDDPSQTLVADLKKHEHNKALLLERKRKLEANGPISARGEPITDAQLDAYISRIHEIFTGPDAFLAKRIFDTFVERVIVKKGSMTGTVYYTFPPNFFSSDLSPLRMPAPEGLGVR